jgi:hypothetical protein
MGVVRDEEGNFEIAGVSPGTYTLIANRDERDSGRFVGRLPVQVGTQDLEGILVPLSRPVEVKAFLKVQGQDTAAFAGTRIVLEPLQGTMNNYIGPVEPAGGATIANVPPGRYRLAVANPPEGTYLKSVKLGGQEVSDSGFDVASGTEVEILLSANAPQVHGTVRDPGQQTVAGATVVLVPARDRRDRYWLYRTTISDQNGSFSVSGVPPGNYTAIALLSPEDGIWQDPGFISQKESRGKVLALVEGANETVPLGVE